VFVGCGNDFGIADGTAWLNHSRSAGVNGLKQSIGKGEVCIRGNDAPLRSILACFAFSTAM